MSDQSGPKFPRRSFLFSPGDSLPKIQKAARLPVDAVILDLEDAVTVSRKEEARRQVARALADLNFGRRERLVRVNEAATPFFRDDILAVAAAGPEGIVLPKVESGAEMETAGRLLAEVEEAQGLPGGSIRLWALIETPLGVMNLPRIVRTGARLEGLLCGGEDLVAAQGAMRSRGGWELFFARSAVVTAAAAYGLVAIDTVYIDFRDLRGLEEEALFVRGLGYMGKLAIHPDQVAIINRCFSPSEDEIARARRLLQAAAEHEASGAGVFALEGRMVDRPLVRAAGRLLARARAAGLIDE